MDSQDNGKSGCTTGVDAIVGDATRNLPNGIFRCSISATEASYIVSVYDNKIRKTIFLGRYTELSAAAEQLDEYKSKTHQVIKKTYLTY